MPATRAMAKLPRLATWSANQPVRPAGGGDAAVGLVDAMAVAARTARKLLPVESVLPTGQLSRKTGQVCHIAQPARGCPRPIAGRSPRPSGPRLTRMPPALRHPACACSAYAGSRAMGSPVPRCVYAEMPPSWPGISLAASGCSCSPGPPSPANSVSSPDLLHEEASGSPSSESRR